MLEIAKLAALNKEIIAISATLSLSLPVLYSGILILKLAKGSKMGTPDFESASVAI